MTGTLQMMKSENWKTLIISGNRILFLKDEMWPKRVSWNDGEVLDEIPALLNTMGIFPFTVTKSSFHLPLASKSMWRHSGISPLETDLAWFRHSHSFPALHSSPKYSRALSLSSFTTQVSHRKELPALSPTSPPSQRLHSFTKHLFCAICFEWLLTVLYHWSRFHWPWEHLNSLGKAWMKFLEVQQVTLC